MLVTLVCGGVAFLGAGEEPAKKTGCGCGSKPVVRQTASSGCFINGSCVCPVYAFMSYGSSCMFYCIVCENGEQVDVCGMFADCGLPTSSGCPAPGSLCVEANCHSSDGTTSASLDGEQLRIDKELAKRGLTKLMDRPVSDEELEKSGKGVGLKVLSNDVVNVRDPKFGDTITVQLVLVKGSKMGSMTPKSSLAPVMAFGWQIAEDKSAPLIDPSLIVKSDEAPSILMTKGNGGTSYSIFRQIPQQ